MFINYTNFDPLVQASLAASTAQQDDCPIYVDLCLTATNYYENKPESERSGNFFDLLQGGLNFPFRDGTFDCEPDDESFRIAHSHHLLMEDISTLIDDKDRQYIAYILNAIVNGALPMFAQIMSSLASGNPSKFQSYIDAVTSTLNSNRSGVMISLVDGIILLHAYHGSVAIAVEPKEMLAAIVPIKTEWDGTVVIVQGEVISPSMDELMEQLQKSCVQRVLIWYEDNFKKKIPTSRRKLDRAA